MGLYNFAVDTGQLNPGKFHSILESFRSDSEQRNTPIAIHDEESVDIKYARRLADEMIFVSGAEVMVFIRTDNEDFDAVFDEDPDPTYFPAVSMKAYFKPEPLQTELAKWGADTPNRTEVIFSHHQILEKFGERMLRQGDVLQLPYNAANLKPKNYRVLNATPSGNFRYIWLYMSCQVETLTADVTVRVEDDMPEIEEEVRNGGVYRESL